MMMLPSGGQTTVNDGTLNTKECLCLLSVHVFLYFIETDRCISIEDSTECSGHGTYRGGYRSWEFAHIVDVCFVFYCITLAEPSLSPAD